MLTLEQLTEGHRESLEPIIGPLAFEPQPDTDCRAVMFDGECVGLVMLRLAPEDSIEINVTTIPSQQRKGYGLQAAKKVLRIAFEHYGLPHVHARCLKGRAGQRLVDKLPFQYGGSFQGQEVYQMTKSHWQSTLASENDT